MGQSTEEMNEEIINTYENHFLFILKQLDEPDDNGHIFKVDDIELLESQRIREIMAKRILKNVSDESPDEKDNDEIGIEEKLTMMKIKAVYEKMLGKNILCIHTNKDLDKDKIEKYINDNYDKSSIKDFVKQALTDF